jgi:Tol biopolymer transport system component
MTTQATTQKSEARSKRKSVVLLSLALGAALSATVALAGTARQAEAVVTEKVVFASNRTTGTGVNNPTGDFEIFRMNPDGTGVTQLTSNKVDDFGPVLSPDKTKVAYHSYGVQTSNPEGDYEIYVMNASDGRGKKNLSNNGTAVSDYDPVFSPGGKKIAYSNYGKQASNLEGDYEIYVMNALDGTGKKNLSNNGVEVAGSDPVVDYGPDFSPSGEKIAYETYGKQASNPEGDAEVYRMNALDGKGKRNLSNNGDGVEDASPLFSPDGAKVAYVSYGEQASNPEGDQEVYVMRALDGTGKRNLSNNGVEVAGAYPVDDHFPEFSPGGKRIAYMSEGQQTSNPEGDTEVYRMSALDGTGKKNLSDNGDGINDIVPFFSPDGQKVFYESYGEQTSNPEGDREIYRMNTLDGTSKKNLTHNGLGVQDFIYPD